jgi:hypothetical protein
MIGWAGPPANKHLFPSKEECRHFQTCREAPTCGVGTGSFYLGERPTSALRVDNRFSPEQKLRTPWLLQQSPIIFLANEPYVGITLWDTCRSTNYLDLPDFHGKSTLSPRTFNCLRLRPTNLLGDFSFPPFANNIIDFTRNWDCIQ